MDLIERDGREIWIWLFWLHMAYMTFFILESQMDKLVQISKVWEEERRDFGH